MKYTPINGWTKETIKEQLIKKNNGTRAMINNLDCAYEASDGNRCAVGCFIPDDHPALDFHGDVNEILDEHVFFDDYTVDVQEDLREQLASAMPLPKPALKFLQQIHDWDGINTMPGIIHNNPQYQIPDVRERMLLWVDENVA